MKQALKITLWAAGVLLYAAIQVSAQQTTVTVKPSPASDTLVHAAQDLETETKAFTNAQHQAQSTYDSDVKALQTKIQELYKTLMDQVRADKRYKGQMDEIDVVQKQMKDHDATASVKFNQSVGPIQNSIGKDRALIDGLIPIVRKENDLPDSATFDTATQKWSTSAPAKK
jgi:hypothetical protein